jgi:hypothetical protein
VVSRPHTGLSPKALVRIARFQQVLKMKNASSLTWVEVAHELTEMDRVTGDGDLGTSMERAAKVVQGAVGSYPLDDVPATFRAIGHTLRSGPNETPSGAVELLGDRVLGCPDPGAKAVAVWLRAASEEARVRSGGSGGEVRTGELVSDRGKASFRQNFARNN